MQIRTRMNGSVPQCVLHTLLVNVLNFSTTAHTLVFLTCIRKSKHVAHHCCISIIPTNITDTGISISSAHFESELCDPLVGTIHRSHGGVVGRKLSQHSFTAEGRWSRCRGLLGCGLFRGYQVCKMVKATFDSKRTRVQCYSSDIFIPIIGRISSYNAHFQLKLLCLF